MDPGSWDVNSLRLAAQSTSASMSANTKVKQNEVSKSRQIIEKWKIKREKTKLRENK